MGDSTNRDAKKNEWEKEHVKRALQFHDKKYGTQIEIMGRSTDIYPDLIRKDKGDWDWVGYNNTTQEEVAIEVKRIKDAKLEEKTHFFWELFAEVQKELNNSGTLPGTFFIGHDIPKKGKWRLNTRDKQKLKEVLYNIICEVAHTIESGKSIDLKPQIKSQLPFDVPELNFLSLHKINDKSNEIIKGQSTGGFYSINFVGNEFNKFQELIERANSQLIISKTKVTILVLIGEGHRPIDVDAIEEAFTKMRIESYANIKHVYLVKGEEVAVIRLPNSE